MGSGIPGVRVAAAGSATSLSALDLGGITRAIDNAVSSLKTDEHGALVMQMTGDGLNVGFVAKGPKVGPFKSSVLLTVTKPMAGPLAWGASARVSFLVSQPAEPGVFATFRGARRVIKTWVPEPWATVKALALCFGFEVKFKEA